MNNLIRDKEYSLDLVLNRWKKKSLGGKRIRRTNKRLEVFRRYGTDCVYCGLKGTFFAVERHKKGLRNSEWHINLYAEVQTGGFRIMTMDHVKPKSKGGSNGIQNLRPACSRCNSEKGSMSVSKWMAIRGSRRVKYSKSVIDWARLRGLSGWIRRIKFMWYTRRLITLPRKKKWIEV